MSPLSAPSHRAAPVVTVADHVDRHTVTLESLLAILRSPRLGDRAARNAALEAATDALIQLRAATDHERRGRLEPVTVAFGRLGQDLRRLARFGDIDVQLVDPPASGRALPAEIARGARAIARSALLVMVDGGEARRVRIQWDCDGLNLLMSFRDDGSGELSARDDALRPVTEWVTALDGTLSVSSTPGWGSVLEVVLPLDPRPPVTALGDGIALTSREEEVLRLLLAGARNRAIARELGISDNTVKFHVSNLLRKTGTASRGELAAAASH